MAGQFNPDAFVSGGGAEPPPSSGGFDPDAFLGIKPAQQQPQAQPKKPNAIDEFIMGLVDKHPEIAKVWERTVGQGSAVGRIIQGAADLPVGAMQLGMNVVGLGDVANDKIAEINRVTEQQRGPDAGFDWWRAAGGVATPMGVLGLMGKAVTTGGRVGKGAVSGAVVGAASPVTNTEGGYWDEKMGQVMGGAVLGAALPGGWEVAKAGGRGLRNVFGPMMGKDGANAAAGRLAREVAGDRVDDVITAMSGPAAGRFPGMTAGQAATGAGSAEFSALQKIAEKFAPSEYGAIDDAQKAARVGILERMAGGPTDDAINTLKTLRGLKTKPMYEGVNRGASVDVTDIVAGLDKMITGKPGNTELVTELNKIKAGLTGGVARTGLPGKATAEAVSSSIDGIKAAIAKKDNAFIQGELLNMREKLKDLLPDYRAADEVFKARSIPINQMSVARELQSKLSSPTGAETAGTFLRSLDDSAKIIKSATGMSRYNNIDQVLSPAQASKARYVAEQLENDIRLNTLARRGNEAARKTIGDVTDPVHQVRILHRVLVIINDVIGRLEGKATKATMSQLAELMKDPQEMAKVMMAAKPKERSEIVNAIMTMQAIPASMAGAQDTK